MATLKGLISAPRESEVWFTRKSTHGYTEHNWPSNFFIEPDGTHVEGEFQAAKHARHNPWRAVVLKRLSPGKAKKYGRQWKLSAQELMEWDANKDGIMFGLILQKAMDWDGIFYALIDTKSDILVEINWWHDNEWGWCTCKKCHRVGKKNKLGRAWMAVRDELQDDR